MFLDRMSLMLCIIIKLNQLSNNSLYNIGIKYIYQIDHFLENEWSQVDVVSSISLN